MAAALTLGFTPKSCKLARLSRGKVVYLMCAHHESGGISIEKIDQKTEVTDEKYF